MEIARSDEEISKLLTQCYDMIDSGVNPFFGMSYIQGVKHTIQWMLGEERESPLAP